jgi:hypothetical protein
VPAVALLAQPLEHGLSVIVAGDSFAVDQTGLHFERLKRFHNQRIALCPVMAAISPSLP